MAEGKPLFCDMCGHLIERDELAGRCVVCGRKICKKCGVLCAICGKVLCREHAFVDKSNFYCEEHIPLPEPEKSDCFIVTAVYGTSDITHLPLFYRFRDVFLDSSCLGKKIVNIYYQISPPFASLIRKNTTMRYLTRSLIIHPIYQILKIFF